MFSDVQENALGKYLKKAADISYRWFVNRLPVWHRLQYLFPTKLT